MTKKGMPWLRLYTEFAHDPKVQMLPEVMQRRLIMLFCFQREEVLNSMTDEQICYGLRISQKRWQETRLKLFQSGFINSCEELKKGGNFLRNFAARQKESDNYAARKRKQRQNAGLDTFSHETKLGHVTTLSRDMSQLCPNADKEKEEDKDKDNKNKPPPPPLGGGSAQQKKTSQKKIDREIENLEVMVIFDFWKKTMRHPRAILDKKRKEVIQKALKFGFCTSDLFASIEGCARTPHNMGNNDRGEIYDGLHVIFKDANQIERFIRNFNNPPRPKTKLNVKSEANDEVLNKWFEKGEIKNVNDQ